MPPRPTSRSSRKSPRAPGAGQASPAGASRPPATPAAAANPAPGAAVQAARGCRAAYSSTSGRSPPLLAPPELVGDLADQRLQASRLPPADGSFMGGSLQQGRRRSGPFASGSAPARNACRAAAGSTSSRQAISSKGRSSACRSQQDFAVGLRQLRHGLGHTARPVSRAASRLLGEGPAASNGGASSSEERSGQDDFPVHRSPPRQMVAPQVEQPFIGLLAQPQAKRHGSPPQEVVHPPHHFQLRLLHDVRRIDRGRMRGSRCKWTKPRTSGR